MSSSSPSLSGFSSPSPAQSRNSTSRSVTGSPDSSPSEARRPSRVDRSSPSTTIPPSTPPRGDPLRLSRLSPRSDSLPSDSSPLSCSRSPRLGQDSFDRETRRHAGDCDAAGGFSASPARSGARTGGRVEESFNQPKVARRLFEDEGAQASQVQGVGFMVGEQQDGMPRAPRARASSLGQPRSSTTPHDSPRAGTEWEQFDDQPDQKMTPAALELNGTPQVVPGVRASSSGSSTLTVSSKPFEKINEDESTLDGPKKPTTKPSFFLLFALTSRADRITVVLPAIAFSILAGLVPPYMTEVIGQAFSNYSNYSLAVLANPPLSRDELDAAKHTLLTRSQTSTITFAAMGLTIFLFQSLSTWLWTIHGERAVRALRLEVFEGVGKREMAWFDTGMGTEATKEGEEKQEGNEESGAGSGGLLGRFTKETDDVRMATAAPCGLVIQYLTSFFVALALSFYRSYILTFVVLASFPIVAFVVAFTEAKASVLVLKDREYSMKSASRLDRVLGAIPTVKAFNAEEREVKSFAKLTNVAFDIYSRLHFIWGLRGGIVQFIILSMFVQGFWFGWWLVSTGRSSAAAVNTCFWACLVASSYVQSCVPLLVTLEKGKIAMAGMLDLARQAPEASSVVVTMRRSMIKLKDGNRGSLPMKMGRRGRERSWQRRIDSWEGSEPLNDGKHVEVQLHDFGGPLSPHPFTLPATTPTMAGMPTLIPLAGHSVKSRGRTAPRVLRKLRPATFTGELSLRNVTFHYPSRPAPAPPVLKDVSLYLAARETTFIVGGSGSGKSTVAGLLLGFYAPDSGRVEVDEQGLEWIDESWLRSHAACVSQGAAVLFDGTVHDNVAMGVVGQAREDGTLRQVKDVTRDEVIAACRGALIHDFVRDLPNDYDTWLSGEKGAALSGGQRQRLAIARAWIRDPTVLILDEATSALDATSRLLVSEAVKRWRKNRTTIIITHDLSPIDPEDFVYVMAEGQIVEQGYRGDLEIIEKGPFNQLAQHQHQTGVAEVDYADAYDEEVLETLALEFGESNSAYLSPHSTPRVEINEAPDFHFPGAGIGGGMHDVARASRDLRAARRASAEYVETLGVPSTPPRHSSSTRSSVSSQNKGSSEFGGSGRQVVGAPIYNLPESGRSGLDSSLSFSALEQVGAVAVTRRPGIQRIKHKSYTGTIDLVDFDRAYSGKEEGLHEVIIQIEDSEHSYRAPRDVMSLVQIAHKFYPTIPNKVALFIGLFLSIVVGVATPVFSFLLAKLIANLGNSKAGSTITTTSLLVLLVAAIDGSSDFLKFYLLERCAMGWVAALRRRGLGLVIRQDKSFFDRSENATGALVHALIKDAEDARLLVGTVVSQFVTCATMLLLGLTWACITGWELTLVGVGFTPLFLLGTRGLQVLLSRHEVRNKVLRENVSRRFHLNISNIKAIRSMSIESVVKQKFEQALQEAYAGGLRAAPLSGMGNGVSVGLTFMAEAAMVYVGAVLIAKGRYTFEKMTTIFSLIIFSITFAAQIAVYLPGLTKSQEAIIDLSRLLGLDTNTAESEGTMVFPVKGAVTFENVNFTYPSRPDVPILRDTSFSIKAGECVGIVGASGSGKSTVTSLLQRLYEPSSGTVLLDGRPLSRVDTKFLRNHVAVVSQHPALFDLSIADNISYGANLKLPSDVLQAQIKRAARLSHVHDFIMSLPRGYETRLGENASLISGGQLQRLQLARALMQDRELLLLDECTSALDATNQALVMQTIEEVKKGRTTIIVTHKLDVMRKCDWLVVMDQGQVVETGTVDDLRARGGHFAQLASGGEWEAS